MDYYNFGISLISKHPESRTIRGEIDGRVLWIKQTVPPKARIWHRLQKALAAIFAKPILRGTVSEGRAENLRAEADRLRLFKERGFHVPEVLAVYDEFMVLVDAGPQLRASLDETKDLAVREQTLLTAIRALADLHTAGLAHGRPYMRDMTWDGRTIGFLDLEEDPVKVMPLAAAQARDVWIFLSAASRYARPAGQKMVYEPAIIHALLAEYQKTANPETLKELRAFVTFLRPIRRLLDNDFLWPKIGTDARQSVFINRCIETLM